MSFWDNVAISFLVNWQLFASKLIPPSARTPPDCVTPGQQSSPSREEEGVTCPWGWGSHVEVQVKWSWSNLSNRKKYWVQSYKAPKNVQRVQKCLWTVWGRTKDTASLSQPVILLVRSTPQHSVPLPRPSGSVRPLTPPPPRSRTQINFGLVAGNFLGSLIFGVPYFELFFDRSGTEKSSFFRVQMTEWTQKKLCGASPMSNLTQTKISVVFFLFLVSKISKSQNFHRFVPRKNGVFWEFFNDFFFRRP